MHKEDSMVLDVVSCTMETIPLNSALQSHTLFRAVEQAGAPL